MKKAMKMNVKEQIAGLVEEKIRDSGHFLVEVKTLPGKIVVFIDHPLTGVKLEDCIAVARFLQDRPGLEQLFEKNELEVSSPGMDEPFKVLPQYVKRQGKRVSVITFDGRKREGILISASEEGIELEETAEKKTNGKKELVSTLHRIPFSQIKETRMNYSIDKLLK
jgi:ribosome maturation factor RimP